MVLEARVSSHFKFNAFTSHFPDGGEAEMPELISDNAIECGGSVLRMVIFHRAGTLGMRIFRCDTGALPLKITALFQVSGAPAKLEITFLPDWCKSVWEGVAAKIRDAARVATGRFGWDSCPIPAEKLRLAAAQADGILKVQSEITVHFSSSATLASHESCLRGNIKEVIAGLVGSPPVQLLGPDELRIELPKALLGAHSDVLRAALDSTMQEGQSLIINFGNDLKRQALQDFAICLCSGGLPSDLVTSWERLFDLLVVADRYGVCPLVDACISFLSMSITDMTVAQLMKIADEAGFAKLLRCLLYYCLGCSARMTHVIDSDEYTHFSSDLLRNIFAHQEVIGSGRFLKTPNLLQYLQVDKEFDDTTDWSALSTSKLRRACFERDLSASGTPRELVSRLSAPTSHGDEEPQPKRQRCT